MSGPSGVRRNRIQLPWDGNLTQEVRARCRSTSPMEFFCTPRDPSSTTPPSQCLERRPRFALLQLRRLQACGPWPRILGSLAQLQSISLISISKKPLDSIARNICLRIGSQIKLREIQLEVRMNTLRPKPTDVIHGSAIHRRNVAVAEPQFGWSFLDRLTATVSLY